MRSYWKILSLPCALCLATTAAFAHSKPKVMIPDADSIVSAPGQVSIEFTEGLEAKFSSLKLTDAKGADVAKTSSVVDPSDHKHMTLGLPRLPPGVYSVHWTTAATDGHRAEGQYSFTVK